MGTELVSETLYSNELTQLCAREDYIESNKHVVARFGVFAGVWLGILFFWDVTLCDWVL
jgi:hypothetical protein